MSELIKRRFQLNTDESVKVTVDLATQSVTLPDGSKVEFPVDAFSKMCLLEGIDELGYIQKHEEQIKAYEAARFGTLNTLQPVG